MVVAARRLALIRSTPRQHCLVDSPTRAWVLDNDTNEAPGVPAGRRWLAHATALDSGSLLPFFEPRPPIHHTSSRLHSGRPRPRQHVDWLRHHYVVLLPISNRAGFGRRRSWDRHRLRCDAGQWRKCRMLGPVPHSKTQCSAR